ncbi:conserved protein of unknown function [Candidatus Promineifilum breve]|uniref:DinB-like domain-containing protein n=1 Tax=Candidatus Promineifilum breve TaxID=1806508 RepID=A0A160T837_9CHLR|nr:DinB family protein [Candidatus Promineifilum breve]CUS05859.1 conserved protein of unknown function [Candidatus Promineifilum breve]
MSDPLRQAKIESYGQAHGRLENALRAFPPGMWTYRPDASDWTIHEIIIHIADSEVNSYVRCRRLIAEPGSEVLGYDEAGWARRLDYHRQDTAMALELFRLLRRGSYELIRDLPDGVWAHTVVHSDSGRMTFDDWLDTYERHVPEHIAQMRAIYETWRLEQEGS